MTRQAYTDSHKVLALFLVGLSAKVLIHDLAVLRDDFR